MKIAELRAAMRALFLIWCVAVLGVAIAGATLPTSNVPAGPDRSCCATMVHEAGDCPPQPLKGMSGSCCNMQFCVQLFLQTGEVRLDPGCREVEWGSFVSGETSRSDRPPVPPPRA